MMGHPNANMQKHLQHIYNSNGSQSVDTLRDNTRDGLDNVNQTAQALIAAAMANLEQARQDGDNNKIQEAIAQLQQAIDGPGKQATAGVEAFKSGVEAEQRAIEQVLDESQNIEDGLHEGERWLNDASSYYSQSKNHLENAANGLGSHPNFDDALASVDPDNTKTDRRRGFWQGVAATALGIEATIQRVQSFPSRMRDRISQGINNRVEAVNSVATSFSDRISNEYNALKDGITQVGTNIADGMGSVRDGVKNSALSAYDSTMALGQTVGEKIQTTALDGVMRGTYMVADDIYPPIKNFITNRAIPAIKSATSSIKDFVFESTENFKVDFRTNLEKRRMARQTQDMNGPEVEIQSQPDMKM